MYHYLILLLFVCFQFKSNAQQSFCVIAIDSVFNVELRLSNRLNKIDVYEAKQDSIYNIMLESYEHFIIGFKPKIKLTEHQLGEIQDSVIQLENKIGNFQKEIIATSNFKRDSIRYIVESYVLSEIDSFAFKRDHKIILSSDCILFCDSCNDLTAEIIQYLARKR